MSTAPGGMYWLFSVLTLFGLSCPATAQDTCSTTFLVNGYTQSKGGVQAVPVGNIRAKLGGKATPVTGIRLSSQPLHWVLVIDASGSMVSTFWVPGPDLKSRTKWHSAIDLARKIVGSVPKDSDVGVLMFWGVGEETTPPTKDKAVLQNELEHFRAIGDDNQKPGRTPLWDSIARASSMFTQASDRNVLVVITDGGDNTSHLQKRGLESKLAQSGVRVFTFGILDRRPLTEEERFGASDISELAENRGGIALTLDWDFLVDRKPAEQDQAYSTIVRVLNDFAANSYEVDVNTSVRTKVEALALKTDTRHIQLAYPRAIMPCSGRE